MAYRVKVDDRDAIALLLKAKKLDMRRPVRQSIVYLEGETKKQFVTETDYTGKKWADLKPSTWKQKKSGKIGRESSVMVNSIYSRLINQYSGEVGVGAEYAIYFDGGTKNMEARPILGFNEARERRMQSIFETHIDKALNG